MSQAVLEHPGVTAALTAAAELLGMEAVFIGAVTDTEFSVARLTGPAADTWPGAEAARTRRREDSLCHWMLAGAPAVSADVVHDPAYAAAGVQHELGIGAYVGVPITGSGGEVLGTLCGIDRGCVEIPEDSVAMLRRLADVIAAHIEARRAEGPVIRRTAGGWSVQGDEPGDLVTSMVLADLLATDLDPGSRPGREPEPHDELSRLRASVTQLEHALAARVQVERAIGVLAERRRTTPQAAFEVLRKAARRRGLRVHDLSGQVVASVTAPGTVLPDELG